uniref:Uncharacterized protein n=1 Tax=Acrobeloides nanus TaxID=290746 RepID=A0A914DGD4_9BILA
MVPDANGVWFQTGVMSTYFYNNYNGILAQRVYARVSSYCSWFNTTTNGEVQCVYANTAPVVSITTITTPVNTASTTTIPATTPTTPSSITWDSGVARLQKWGRGTNPKHT